MDGVFTANSNPGGHGHEPGRERVPGGSPRAGQRTVVHDREGDDLVAAASGTCRSSLWDTALPGIPRQIGHIRHRSDLFNLNQTFKHDA